MVSEVVVAAFILTQLCYFGVNCGLLGLFVRRPSNTVDERTLGRVLEGPAGRQERRRSRAYTDGGSEMNAAAGALTDDEHVSGPQCRLSPSYCRPIHVFVPLLSADLTGVEKTLRTIAHQSYPMSSITISVVYEGDETTAAELDEVIEPHRSTGLEVVPVEVDRDALAAERAASEWLFTGTGVPSKKAALLAQAYESRSLPDEHLVTVFDPGTQFPSTRSNSPSPASSRTISSRRS